MVSVSRWAKEAPPHSTSHAMISFFILFWF
jgi:hypothetical protein